MPAGAGAGLSLTVSELQLRVEELAGQLRSQREEYEEALQREAAIAEILHVINEPDGDLARVFSVMIERATQLCSASYGYVWLYDGERVRAVAAFAQQPFRDWLRDREPYVPSKEGALGQAILHKRLVHVVDATEHETYRTSRTFREVIDKGGVRTLLHVPLCKGSDVLGVITVYRQERRPFSDRQIGLLESFAVQAVVALENARLLSELRERTRELTSSFQFQSATSAVLNVISRSPTDAQPVFDAIAESAAQLCEAEFCHVFRFDGELIFFMASFGHTPEATEAIQHLYPRSPGRGSCAARAIMNGTVEQVPDVRSDPNYTHGSVADVMRINSIVAVPMLKEGRPVGAIALLRAAVGFFPQRQIELLQTFADQAVIAINNVGLFDEVQARARDLQESLEYQTATSDVLQVISRSAFDLQPVLQTLADTAVRLCEAEICHVLRREGELFRAAAVAASSPEVAADAIEYQRFLEAHPLSPGRGSLTGRIALERRAVQIADVTADPEYVLTEAMTIGKTRTQFGVPLMREGSLIGVIIVSRQRVAPFTDRQISLLCTFADQAVIAIENSRLLTEQREALEQQTATANVLKVISRSTFDLQAVLDTLTESAARLCETEMAAIVRPKGEAYYWATSYGFSSEFTKYVMSYPLSPGRDTVVGRVLLEGAIAHVPDVLADPEFGFREGQRLGDYRSVLAIPLQREGTLVGVLLLIRRRAQAFTDKQIDLATTFADQAVIAIENSRLLGELRQSEARHALVSDAVAEGIYEWNIETNALWVSQRLIDIFGFVGRELKAADWNELVHPEDFESYRSAIQDCFKGIARRLDCEYRVRHADGAYRWIEDRGVPVRNAAGQAVRLVGAVTDVTARKESERALREALEQQTATADILRVISGSPADVQPTFEAIATSAARLCEAEFSAVVRFENGVLHLAATNNLSSEEASAFHSLFPRPPSRSFAMGRAFVDGCAVQLDDVLAEADYDPHTREVLQTSLGYRTFMAVPIFRAGMPIGAVGCGRRQVKPFSAAQIQVLNTFAEQAAIALDNVRLFTELRDRTRDLEESLEYQTATSDVLKAISRSTFDLQSVLDTLSATAARLCAAELSFITRRDDDAFRFVTAVGSTPDTTRDAIRLKETVLDRHSFRPGRDTITGRVIAERAVVQIADVAADPEYALTELTTVGKIKTLLGVPLMREGEVIGTMSLARQRIEPFTDKQIELVRIFADQAVIAIENTRLLVEQREALEQQTATTEVLEVINSSPGNLQPVFDAMLERAVRLSESAFGMMNLYENNRFRRVALRGAPESLAEQEPSLPASGPNNALSRLVNGEDVVHIEDLASSASYREGDPRSRGMVELAGARSLLAVALRKDGNLIGTLTAYRQEVRPFTDKQIALLESFAAQAVIAIENARLLDELRQHQAELARSVDELTATGDVLKTISRSTTDLKAVLDTLLETVARLCRADQTYMFRRHDELHHLVAAHGVSPEGEAFIRSNPFKPEGGTTSGRVAMERRTVHIEDVLGDPEYTYNEGQKAAGFRTMLGIPLLREENLVGVFVLGRTRVEPFSPKEIELANSFADQAVIAIENARLFEELHDRQAELRVTFDNMGDGVAMFDGDRRLAAWNRNFQEIIGLPEEWLARRPTYAEYLGLLAARGEFGSENVEALLVDTDKELRRERTRPDGRVIEVRRNAVPGGGFVLIYGDVTERKRSEEKIRAARDVAESALKELKTAQASLIHAEKMASLGQLTAGIAHEIKNPLNFVNNFAGLSIELLEELKDTVAPMRESLGEDGRAELDETIAVLNMNLDKIRNHGQRADGIVKSMLAHSRGGSSERQAVDINAVLEEALNLAYHGARAQDQSFNVTLERDLQADAAPIEIVPQDVTRVFLNLIGNGFYAVAKRRRQEGEAFRPTVKVTTRDLPDAVEIAIRDNGVGIPPHHRQRLFQPFFTTKPTGEGTGLGLSISYDIVTQQHGGTIVVDSEPGQFTEFTIRLPRRGQAAAAGRTT